MIGRDGTGVSTYARGLVAAAERIGRPPVLLCADHEDDGRLRRWSAAAFPTVPVRRVRSEPGDPAPRRFFGRDIFRRAHIHFGLHRRLMTLDPPERYGIMHWTYPVPMRMAGWANIYTVHDVIPLQRPDLSPVSLRRHRAVMRAVCETADRIVTVSEAARHDIVSMLGLDGAFVSNCGQAIADHLVDPVAAAPLGLPNNGYFLFCGAVEPRKNLVRLLSAFRRSGVPHPLVIAGPDGWRSRPINALIARTPNAIRVGYVGREVLLALIGRARGLLFPSLAEGFGLPVLEAMRLGTPVLTSQSGALAEVAADAALLADPLDEEALAHAIRRLARDEVLVADLARRGRIRAQAYSVERFAERLAEVYDDVADVYGDAERTRYAGFAAG